MIYTSNLLGERQTGSNNNSLLFITYHRIVIKSNTTDPTCVTFEFERRSRCIIAAAKDFLFSSYPALRTFPVAIEGRYPPVQFPPYSISV